MRNDTAPQSFPTDIVALIAAWNRLAAVDFFTCRARLAALATANRAACAGAVTLPVATLLADPAPPALIAFCDDDDWFAPDPVPALLAAESAADVLVFPLIRIGIETFTLVRAGAPCTAARGPCHDFVLRYHTNNYVLRGGVVGAGARAAMVEHRDASCAAARLGLQDGWIAHPLAVTSKTPCAASVLADVVANEDRFGAYLRAYLETLKRLSVPAELGWITPPLWETVRLFEAALPRRLRRG